jgi:hypothetical protein
MPPSTRAGTFDVTRDDQLRTFLSQAKKPGTIVGYKRKVRLWKAFWRVCRASGLAGNKHLDGVPLGLPRTVMWIRFIWYLRVSQAVHPESIGEYLSAIKDYLADHWISTEFASDDITQIKKAKQAALHRTRAELRAEFERKEARMKLPVFDELTERIFVIFWTGTAWDGKGLQLKVVAVAVVLMDVFGFRSSNVVLPRANGSDHALRAEDFTIIYAQGEQGESRRTVGGTPASRGIATAHVLEIHLLVLSRKRSVKAESKVITSGDERGRRAITVLMDWLRRSEVRRGDILTTCRAHLIGESEDWVLTSYALNKGIKQTADSLGFPPEHYSSCSYRKGLATNRRLEGESNESITQRGSWKHASTMLKSYDQSERLCRAPGTKGPMTIGEARSLVPPSKRARFVEEDSRSPSVIEGGNDCLG